jgi:hypothetical protein
MRGYIRKGEYGHVDTSLARLGKLVQVRAVYDRLGQVRSVKNLMGHITLAKARLGLVKAC